MKKKRVQSASVRTVSVRHADAAASVKTVNAVKKVDLNGYGCTLCIK